MNDDLEIIEVVKEFRNKVSKKASKNLGKKKLRKSLNVSYATISRLIQTGFVRRKTLALFVLEFDGEDANVEDYIKPL